MRLAGISLAFIAVVALGASAARGLDIYFIDVEGGQATLLVTPAGESLLIDAGYGPRGARGNIPAVPNGRDAGRILQAIKGAGLDHLDYLLVTHFHPDHAGGVPEVAAKIPITTFIDYGDPLGSDRMAANAFRNYEPVRKLGRHIVARAGDHLALKDIEAQFVSADGKLIPRAIGDGGETNSACRNVEEHPEDGTENYRSVGLMFKYGAFRFLDVGDLSGMTLTRLACPKDLLGRVSVYLTSHHGDYDSNVPALYAALQPRVVVMNNGVTRGGSPDVFKSLAAEKSIEDLWQLHYSANSGAENSLEPLIANVDDGTQTAYAIRITAFEDGSFRVTNDRNGFTKEYRRNVRRDTAQLSAR